MRGENMNIDISKILNGTQGNVTFDMDVIFNKEDISKTSIKELNDCHVSGSVTKLEDNLYNLDYILEGTMILEDAVSLEPIPYKFKVNDENDYEIGNYLKINENLLDIYEVLWENVVLEVPLRIKKDDNDSIIEGDGWSLNKPIINNSGLEGLQKLLDVREEEK